VLLIMIVTILLIPVAILAVLGLAVTLLYGWIAIGFELGKQISSLFHSTWAAAVEAGIGTFVLSLLGFAASLIPCVGWIVTFPGHADCHWQRGDGTVWLQQVSTRSKNHSEPHPSTSGKFTSMMHE